MRAAHTSLLEYCPVDTFSRHQNVHRESFTDQPRKHHNDGTSSQSKQLRSLILISSARTQRPATGDYYTGSVHAQHIGLAGVGLERPEKQIRIELEKLYSVLQRSDKYQKYREKQPIFTPADVIARRSGQKREGKTEAENIPQSQKDTTVWPDFLDYAFWKDMNLFSGPQSELTLDAGSDNRRLSSPFVVAAFTMLVDDGRQPIHCFAQMHPNSRLGNLCIADAFSGCHQYPDFDFLRTQAGCSRRDGQAVSVYDASIKILTEARPKAKLSITLNLQSYLDLSRLGSLECTTCFYDYGDTLMDRQFGSAKKKLKEYHTSCHYEPDLQGCIGHLSIAFGSQFWVGRMAEYQKLQQRDENAAENYLMSLAATQDVYGTIF